MKGTKSDQVIISIIDLDAEMWHCRTCGFEGFDLGVASIHAKGHLPAVKP